MTRAGLSTGSPRECRIEKEEEFVTTFLEFEYLHRKSRCEMLIGGDDISNDLSRVGLVSASR